MDSIKPKNVIRRSTYILYILIAILTLTTSCSRKALPEASYTRHEIITKNKDINPTLNEMSGKKPDIVSEEIRTNNKELNLFLKEGYGKKIDIGNVKPDDIINSARKYLGVPHRMGGTSSKGIDCSGLVMRAFTNNGIQFPHNSEEQARYGDVIQSKALLQKGDMVFFVNTYKTSKYITHAGIYIGDNQFIHASVSKGVTITSLDSSWWKDKFIFGTRVF